MSDMNVWSGTGRLGKDPEKRMAGNTKICQFSLAVSGRKKDDLPTWLIVCCYGKLAETVAQYCEKGKLVGVTGRLDVREWEDRNGLQRRSVEINADTVVFLGSKPQRDGGGSWGQPQSQPEGGWDQKNSQDEPWNYPDQTQSQAPSGW